MSDHPLESFNAGRRAFLAGSGLMVSFALFGSLRVSAGQENTLGATILNPKLPGDLKIEPMLDAWIKIDASGVTVCSGKVELGTGVKTALWQVAADQLCMPLHKFRFITADTALTPDEGYTAGSHTMADGGTAIFHAATQVRQMLVDAAASKMGVGAETLTLRDGVISAVDGRQLSYEQAAMGVNLHRFAQETSPAADPAKFKYIGKPVPRVDILAKVTGGAAYVQDMRPEGLLHARVVRPPNHGATLVSADVDTVARLPGVVKVVRDGDYLAVIARDEWQAIVAMRTLQSTANWKQTERFPTNATIHDLLRRLPRLDYVTTQTDGGAVHQAPPVPEAPLPPPMTGRSADRLDVTKQYVMHGSIGPSCALAVWRDGMLTVWTHSQGVFPLRAGIAGLLGLPKEQVRCIHVEGSGCYGHNGADDVAADAALLAYRVPGHPIRVQWMRDQEAGWEPLGPAMATSLDVSTDGQGALLDWRHALWSTPHNSRITDPGRLLPAWLIGASIAPSPPSPIPQPEGDADRNAVPLYRAASVRVDMHFVTQMPFRTSAMRSLGAHINVVTIESMMDTLAARHGQDPVDYRLAQLDDPRAREVIQRAADEFGWRDRKRLPRGHGAGFAFARYKNLMGYCALALEIAVDDEKRAIEIVRVVTAVDCGQIVNPDGLTNQIEGGIVQSSSWTLYEQVLIGDEGVKSVDWQSYPILRFPQVPGRIDVHMLDRPGMPFLGAAEIAQGPTAAAIVSAVEQAVGHRPLQLPVVHGLWT
ncbi:MAG TPA: molybdopterin cofactor-binding domain-containing protein [Luteibacter sp.]|uniref:xanthine dehydrogenase family protein molybdopterin-binding subunit n=1 Tax=Luteibacter sp. TaxID=1886636 RepID=UPI002B6CF63C|nr:molybdopterin cofactor-binding domain-containing protein [Luteibacter sp.]HVI56012.1 molybdopterin cofactor-binding domain-containing protein [Luteibacter sp.]